MVYLHVYFLFYNFLHKGTQYFLTGTEMYFGRVPLLMSSKLHVINVVELYVKEMKKTFLK